MWVKIIFFGCIMTMYTIYYDTYAKWAEEYKDYYKIAKKV